jgi:DNA invertase Pin-like site-specific DNA recombinase
MLPAAEKITPIHLARRAYVYIRQSSPKQVLQNRESQANQYALVERAVALGWSADRVQVIDADLGLSGQDRSRAGFQELVSELSLGRVGIILAYEASRLARNNADWYTLLDLATVVGTLIADTDGVYDPRSYNDRLLLGLRGMLSEAELHLLRLRLDAGRQRQVERGSYRQHLPTGLVRLPDGRVVKDPDLAVQRTIALVFAQFRALGTCQAVLRQLAKDGVLLPRFQTSGLHAGHLVWKKPNESALYEMLRNPAYAGAFAYGRTVAPADRRLGRTGRVKRRVPAEWLALHQDVYPAYLSWEEYLANQARLSDNASRYAERMRGAPRKGRALLTGLVVCGACGRQMRVQYKPQTRYLCAALRKNYAAPSCLHLDGASIETVVVGAFFEAIQPAELALLDEVLAAQRADHERLGQHHADQLQRTEYGARLADRQYRAVDPDNRLVAAELERRWELALRAVVEAREAVERFAQTAPVPALGPVLRAQLTQLAISLPALWASGRLSMSQKKTLLRSLIRRIVLSRPVPDRVGVKIVWVSGAVSELTAHPAIHLARNITNYEQLVERVLTMSAQGYQDGEIARRLTAEGFRSARSLHVPKPFVARVRRAHHQPSLTNRFRSHAKIDGYWTVSGLVKLLKVDRGWLYRRIEHGLLPMERHPVTGHYLVVDSPDLIGKLRAQLPIHQNS